MDKYEYKLRLEEIKTLNRKGRFQEAAQVADTIDWTKVQNISTLGIISDVYKINRRFDDAKDMLLLANEKSPQNRRILYALCDLTVKMGQVVESVEYYKEFVQLSPNDNSKYILLYKIYEAQDISLEERIAVLKEYKKREYNEKWAYELAFLYHRIGLATECVEECDQLILWFGEGRYVTKAMELKMLYVPLSPAQQQAYDRQFGRKTDKKEEKEETDIRVKEQNPSRQEKEENREEELDIQVKPMDMGRYNTINLQAELAESVKEVLEPAPGNRREAVPKNVEEAAQKTQEPAAARPEAGMQQMRQETHSGYGGDDAEYQEDVSRVMQASAEWDAQATGQFEPGETENAGGRVTSGAEPDTAGLQDKWSQKIQQGPWASVPEPPLPIQTKREAPVLPGTGKQENLLTQEYDGQIGLALPEDRAVENQITGQMNIEDVLAEWERLKRENEEKRRRETKQWMLQQTGSMFQDFDQHSRDGVLEKLQREEALASEETGQRDGVSDPSALTEVEELEEIEEIENIQEAPLPVRQIQPEQTAQPPERTEEGKPVKAEQLEQQPQRTEEPPEKSVKTGGNTEAFNRHISERQLEEHVRSMTKEEKTLFAPFVPTKGAMRQLVKALDLISLSAFTGNMIITGAPGSDMMKLAKNVIREVRASDQNFSGKIAKISGGVLNTKSAEAMIAKIPNGALIVEKAGKLSDEGTENLLKALNQEHTGIIVFLLDEKRAMGRVVDRNPQLAACFTARFDIAALDSGTLVKYGCQYAYNMEYAIDELGRLALHTRIEDLQTSTHAVTIEEVRDIVDEAVEHANKKSLSHFIDILFRKRYDEDDMIILGERDFI